MAQQYDNTNRGIVSKNDRKEKDNQPDIKGQGNVDGVEYWIDGWKKARSDGSGTFYSLSFKRKDQQQAPKAAAPKAAPKHGSGFDDMDDDIPF